MTQKKWYSLSWREVCALFCCFWVNSTFAIVSYAWGLNAYIWLEIKRACCSDHRPTFPVLGCFSPVCVKRARGRSTCKVREDPGFLLGMSDQMPLLPLGGAVESLGWKLLTTDLTWTTCAFYLNHRTATTLEWCMVASYVVWNYSSWPRSKRVTMSLQSPRPLIHCRDVCGIFLLLLCFSHCLDIVSW